MIQHHFKGTPLVIYTKQEVKLMNFYTKYHKQPINTLAEKLGKTTYQIKQWLDSGKALENV